MKIPLVAQQTLGGKAAPYLRSSRGLLSSNSGSLSLGSALKTHGGESSDSIKKDLKEKSEGIENLQVDNDERGVRVGGYIGSALRELSSLSKRIEKLQDSLRDTNNNLERKNSVESEISSLSTEVERIVTSKPFQKAIATAHAIESALQNRQISRRSLGSVAGFLGDDFVNLISSGSTGAIASLSRGLDRLSGVSAESLIQSPGAVRDLGNLSKDLLGELRSAKAPTAQEAIAEETKEVKLLTAPELRETNFAAAGELALSLRSYQGKDLIRAVASGYIDRPEDLFQLSIKPPSVDRDDRDEKNNKEKEEARSAKRHGLNVGEEKPLSEGQVKPTAQQEPSPATEPDS